MSPFANLGAIFLSRWTTGFAGVAIVSLVVWQLGPLIPFLSGGSGMFWRAAIILALVVMWAAVNGAISWTRRRRRNSLVAALTDEEKHKAEQQDRAAGEEVAALRGRMREALKRLGAGRVGRHLYERPWFVLIGPPGAGKTTALRQSGLHFPLSSGNGEGVAVGGVGGTRLCDWWFAEEAVLIDTAGRYTTQDSDEAVDRAGWLGFLDLLRRARPRQPLNGALVVISLPELAAWDAAARTAHARAVRRRIDEIQERLRLRLPIYLLFSKADRLAGFDAYFGDMDPEARGQVWGVTFPVGEDPSPGVAGGAERAEEGVDRVAGELRLLLDRLEGRLIERLQDERTNMRRAAIAGFPLQMASLAEPLADFVVQAFSGSRIDPAPMLRGVYLTSATQEGTPVDRITGMLARAYGIDQRQAPSLRPIAGRAYFMTRLLREVILGEALLVARDPARERLRRRARLAAFACTGIVTLAGCGLLWRADAANRAVVQADMAAMSALSARLATLRLDPVADDDMPAILPVLEQAAALPYAAPGQELFGIGQGPKIAASNAAARRRVLDRVLLPRLVWRLEQVMRTGMNQPGALYAATRVYLMLGGAGPLDRAQVRGWVRQDWETRFPGELNAALRSRLDAQLDALLAAPLPALTLDGALVSAARSSFGHVTLSQRIYDRIRTGAQGAGLRAWRPADAMDPAGQRYFVRRSGVAMTDGVPGFLTGEGYREALLAALPDAAHEVAAESWVLGQTEADPEDATASVLEEKVVSLWVDDAERAWDAVLNDVALAPFSGPDDAIQAMYVFTSTRSPLRDLLTGAAEAQRLPASSDKQGHSPPATGSSAAQAFESHFRLLAALTKAQGGRGAPLDDVLRLIDQMRQALGHAAAGGAAIPDSIAASGDPAQLLLAEARRQPAPLSLWLRQIAGSGTRDLGQAAQTSAAAAFAAQDGPAARCRALVAGHYPFEAESGADAPIGEFARLFSPGGVLDTFFAAHVRPWADTGLPTWRTRAAEGVQPPVSAATLSRFQQAADIRDAFFPTGGGEPHLRLTISPRPDNDTAATLRLANVSIGPHDGATVVSWPSDGPSQASLGFGAQTSLHAEGSWALLRLLDQGRITTGGGPGSLELRFETGGHTASYGLQSESGRNPFARTLLRGFRCPVMK